MKNMLLLVAMLVLAGVAHAQQDTIAIYFATGKSTLSEGVQNQLVDHIYNDVLQTNQALQIIGYADYVGGNGYNDRLSRARAGSVKRFLLQYGFSDKNVTICIGKGEVERAGAAGREGFTRDRRVDIVINAPAPVQEISSVTVSDPPPPKPVIVREQVAAGKAVAKEQPAIQNLNTLKANETLVLDKIYFYAGRHAIRPESRASLEALYNQLNKFPAVKIAIEGHVCCVRNGIPDAMDDDTREIALSVNRAKAIYDFLVSKGIDKDRLSYKGFGATHRISEENTEEQADKNRRVELRMMQ